MWGGVAARAVVDNTHVVVLRGSGREMMPEMKDFRRLFRIRVGGAHHCQRQPFAAPLGWRHSRTPEEIASFLDHC